MTLGILIFGLGVALLGWHYSHERTRQLRREKDNLVKANERLHAELRRAIVTMSPPAQTRIGPEPKHWADRPYQRIAADLGLRFVDVEAGREAHSHAESSQRQEPA
jgi:hypothetical protein